MPNFYSEMYYEEEPEYQEPGYEEMYFEEGYEEQHPLEETYEEMYHVEQAPPKHGRGRRGRTRHEADVGGCDYAAEEPAAAPAEDVHFMDDFGF